MNLLKQLEAMSNKRDDGGFIHGGHIHFIQGRLSDEDGFPFLKAAIYDILESVPEIFPEDLPEQVERGELEKLNDKQAEKFREMQEHLIMPIEPFDILRVIKAAREYMAKEQQ